MQKGGSLTVGTMVEILPNAFIPEGWLQPKGQRLKRKDYPELFNLMAMTYGCNILNEEFILPNLCAHTGRLIIIKAIGDSEC